LFNGENGSVVSKNLGKHYSLQAALSVEETLDKLDKQAESSCAGIK